MESAVNEPRETEQQGGGGGSRPSRPKGRGGKGRGREGPSGNDGNGQGDERGRHGGKGRGGRGGGGGSAAQGNQEGNHSSGYRRKGGAVGGARGSGGSGHSYGNNNGGGGSGGGRAKGPVTLGLPPNPKLSGVLVTDGAGRHLKHVHAMRHMQLHKTNICESGSNKALHDGQTDNDVEMPSEGTEQCLLCCSENPSYFCLGQCRHVGVCWVCCLRLRALSRDWNCPVCKEQLNEVLITNDRSASLAPAALRDLPGDSSLGVRFADDRVRRAALQLLGYRCTLDACGRSGKHAFGSLRELEDHLWYQHWRQLCRTCLHARPAFICEQYAYGHNDLERHCRYGDRGWDGGGRPERAILPVPPHPLCEFCGERQYNDDALLQHMYRRHHLCSLCERLGRRNEFYASWTCLALHYQDKHHVCAHRDCMRGGYRLIAFNDEEELQLHYLTEHAEGGRQADRDRRLRMQVGPASYADELRNRQGGRGPGGSQPSRAAAAEASDVQVHFLWPEGATAEDAVDARNDGNAELGDSDSDGSGSFERYPPREIIHDESPTPGGGGADEPATTEEKQTNEGRHESLDAAGEDESDEDAEAVAVDDSTPAAEGTKGRAAVARDQGYADQELDPRLRDLDVSCITATEGPRCGQRSCLSAVNAVLCALVEAKSCRDSSAQEESELRESVRQLIPTQVENLERLRFHLDDGGELSKGCDWEPLERVLALRPQFFLLLQAGSRPQTDTTQRNAIGPRQGPDVNLGPAWHVWRLAAQRAIFALGSRERLRFKLYVELCTQRRLEVASAGDVKEFPSLGGNAAPGATANGNWVPQHGKSAVSAERESSPDAQPAPASGPTPAELHSAELFPTLGGGSSTAEQRVTDGPGAGWGRNQRRQELPGTVEAFPTLGGDRGAAAEEAPKWAGARPSVPAAAAAAAPQGGAAGVSRSAPTAPASPPKTDGQDFPSLGGGTSAAAALAAEMRWGAAASSSSSGGPSHSTAGGRATTAAAKPKAISMEDWVKPKAQEPQESAKFDGSEAESFPGLPAGTAPVPAGRSTWGKAAAPSRAAVKALALKERRQQDMDKKAKEALANIAASKNCAKEEEDATSPVQLVELEAMVCISNGKAEEVPAGKASEIADAEAGRKKKNADKKKKVLMAFG